MGNTANGRAITWEWLGGFFDGEGYAGFQYTNQVLKVLSDDKKAIASKEVENAKI